MSVNKILNHIYSYLENKIVDIRLFFQEKGIIINIEIIHDLHELSKLYNQIENLYNNPYEFSQFIKNVNSSIVNNQTLNLSSIFKEFYLLLIKIIQEISSFLTREGIIKESLNLQNIWKIVNNYDYYFGGKKDVILTTDESISTFFVLPNKKIVTTSFQKIYIWDLNLIILRKYNSPIITLSDNFNVRNIGSLSNGNIITLNIRGIIEIWNLKNRNIELTIFPKMNVEYINIFILPNDNIVAIPKNNINTNIHIYDSETGDNIRILSGHKKFINDILLLPNNKLASCGGDQTIKIWNLNNGRLEKELENDNKLFLKLYLLLSNRIVSLSNNTLIIWDIENDINPIIIDNKIIFDEVIIFNDQIISADSDFIIRIWNSYTGMCEKILTGHHMQIESLRILPNNKLISGSRGILEGDEPSLRIWNLETGICEKIISTDGISVNNIIVHPDNRILTNGGKKSIQVWK